MKEPEQQLPHLLTCCASPSQQHRCSQAERTLQKGKMRLVYVNENWDHGAAVNMLVDSEHSLGAVCITENQVVFHVSNHFGE